MIRRIADAYGVRTHRQPAGRLQVDRRHDGRAGARTSSCSAPRNRTAIWSGTYARDKDAAVAAMLLAELAAQAKAAGQTLHEKLDSLYWQHGYHAETQISVTHARLAKAWPQMPALMARFRTDPPRDAGRHEGRARPRLPEPDRSRRPAARRSRSPARRATW